MDAVEDNVILISSGTSIPPKRGDGGGGDLEARVAKLEAHVEHIQNDITEIKAEQRAFRKEVSQEFKSINQEFRKVRTEMKTDFRLVFGALIGTTLSLAGLMAKGFGWL